MAVEASTRHKPSRRAKSVSGPQSTRLAYGIRLPSHPARSRGERLSIFLWIPQQLHGKGKRLQEA